MDIDIILVLLLIFIEIPAAFLLGYYLGKAIGEKKGRWRDTQPKCH